MGYLAEVIADSINPNGQRLTTFHVRFPRFILAEVNTHRMLSKNFESSRAVPVVKRIEAVQKEPFIPEAFGRNKAGMQASEALTDEEAEKAERAWRVAIADAIQAAVNLSRLGVHKQLANRVLEPFSFVSGIISATEWDNFFALRTGADAQPEFRRLALMMLDARNASRPALLAWGGWHLPLVSEVDRAEVAAIDLPKLSAARCARVSYLTHMGTRELAADFTLYERLASRGHMSPLEHPAQAALSIREDSNYRGFRQFRKMHANEAVFGS
jgi:hypothetical protein